MWLVLFYLYFLTNKQKTNISLLSPYLQSPPMWWTLQASTTFSPGLTATSWGSLSQLCLPQAITICKATRYKDTDMVTPCPPPSRTGILFLTVTKNGCLVHWYLSHTTTDWLATFVNVTLNNSSIYFLISFFSCNLCYFMWICFTLLCLILLYCISVSRNTRHTHIWPYGVGVLRPVVAEWLAQERGAQGG